LVAKQAAEVDVLSGGRLRLGISMGWNPVEYEAPPARWMEEVSSPLAAAEAGACRTI
jgi:alkanesulfonate monooxygenase SsuD/methylene tetrahydromethanopterin reductase-like flavin-dependent oxidoreductase (luciferase family)